MIWKIPAVWNAAQFIFRYSVVAFACLDLQLSEWVNLFHKE